MGMEPKWSFNLMRHGGTRAVAAAVIRVFNFRVLQLCDIS